MYQGLEEAVYRNIENCVELANTTRTSFGPTGQNKMVINHIEKLFVTNDAATILNELEVAHPAAKMLCLASKQQEQEAGDGTNLVLMLAGELLHQAEELLRMGLSVTEVAEGYELAMEKALEILPTLVIGKVEDMANSEQVRQPIRSSVMSKQFGNEDMLATLITDACQMVLPKSHTFSVDKVRVLKIVGAGMHSSSAVQGMVFRRAAESDLQHVGGGDVKVAIYSCPLDVLQTETKGTVLIKTADELRNFSRGEEDQMEAHIRSIAETGVKVIVTGGKVGEMALHYVNKYGLMVVRLMSKWDLRRLCESTNSTALPQLTAPTAEEIGHATEVKMDEIGGTNVVIFRHDRTDSAITTLVLRGATDNILDDMERAVDDGVNCFKALTRDPRMLAGAGATEMELARQMTQHAETLSGLEQYAIDKFGRSFEVVVKSLAENAGLKATDVISKLYAQHNEGKKHAGLVFEGEDPEVKDAVAENVKDLYLVKHWAIKYAATAAITVLKVDQIIMAKPAGGPKPKENKNWDED